MCNKEQHRKRVSKVVRRVLRKIKQMITPERTVVKQEDIKEEIFNQMALNYMQSSIKPKKQSNNKFVLERKVSHLSFNDSVLTIMGSAYIESDKWLEEGKINKRLVLIGEEDFELFIPLINQKAQQKGQAEESWVGYRGVVNFSTVSENNPLLVGKYDLFIEISQFIDGEWVVRRDTVGKIKGATNDVIVSTKMYSFTARSNKIFSLTFVHHYAGNRVTILSKQLSDIDPLELTDEEIVVDGKMSRWLKKVYFHFMYLLYNRLPINQQKVSFLSDSRIDISGNFEFIYRKLLEKDAGFSISFFLKPSIKEKKSIGELRSLAKAIATSKYIILDDFYPLIYPLKIRKNAELIQVWHAVGAFKTFGYSRVGMPGGPKPTSINHRNYTKAIVSSKNISPKYAEGFGIDIKHVYPLGAPRTDIFFNKSEQNLIIQKVHKELPFIKGKKVILFAPTFRGNGQQSAYYPYEVIDFKKIYETFSDKDYVFLLKIHPFVQNQPNISYEYDDFYHDVSSYREINDLLLITDVLITDYSSVCFEYALLKKQMIFFSPDLAEYMSTRNFYYDYFNFIPGTFATNTEELIQQIKDEKIDNKRLSEFTNYFFDDLDGKASERFVDNLLNDFYKNDEQQGKSERARYTPDGKIIPEWGKE